MAGKLVRHGTNNGYRSELAAKRVPCERCANAHKVHQKQYTASGKANNLKYGSDDVIDHLYVRGQHLFKSTAPSSPKVPAGNTPVTYSDLSVPVPAGTDQGPTLRDRMNLILKTPPDTPDDTPDYLTPETPDPEPDAPVWTEPPADAEWIADEKAVKQIESNLGLYLSVVGMTLEVIDPYCGPVLGENFDNMVSHWAKLIGNYPAAAKFFLDGKGGLLMAWITALQATWPVLKAVYDHHLSGNIRVVGGQVQRKTPGGMRMDPTMPPGPDTFNYTAG